ncbi:uncharacterized protein C1orf131 homolog [Linepithema humile]|uniref:uncharacterized protein C1orf131 homolog n=1 Tax=Linepithema humile TaxID=83485 RepID=UPI00062384D9|nr:PREDICTED: uncharacterized protein C1orf131 homolog [Linepithema humile]XP_012216209.1 PREDICTED: uncharacterized protein C1orf131 homolog [Linepithema humile]
MDDFVPTRGSQIKKNPTSCYMSMSYEAPKKKSKSTDSSNSKEKSKDNSETKLTPAELKKQQEKEMKKARYDVIKFGMSGFEKPKARRAKVELAISLGAIPPKNRRMNYNALKKRKEKEKQKKEEGHTSGFSNSLLKSKVKKVQKKDNGILGVYGKVPKNVLSKQKS